MENYTPPAGMGGGSGKGKGKGKKKDPNAPKRSQSSYMFFANKMRPKVKGSTIQGFHTGQFQVKDPDSRKRDGGQDRHRNADRFEINVGKILAIQALIAQQDSPCRFTGQGLC